MRVPLEAAVASWAQIDEGFGEFTQLVLEASAADNNLEIPYQIVTDKGGKGTGILVAAHSELTATSNIQRAEPYTKDGTVIHEATYPEMQATATIVSLWPYANHENGDDATLVDIKTTWTPPPDKNTMPLADMVLRIYEQPQDVTDKFLDQSGQPLHGEGRILATERQSIILMATDDTHMEVEEAGHQEVTHEIGLRGSLTGRARIQLYGQGLIRLHDGVLYSPASSMHKAEVILPEDGSVQSKPGLFPELPDGSYIGRLDIDDQGCIRTRGSIGSPAGTTGILNPTLTLEQAAQMLAEPIRWTDETKNFLTHPRHKDRVMALLSLGMPELRYARLAAEARTRLLSELKDGEATRTISYRPIIGGLIRNLAAQRPFNAVKKDYYSK